MALITLLVLDAASCGRYHFALIDASAAGDVAPLDADTMDVAVDARTICDVTAPFTTVTAIESLNDPSTTVGQGGLRLSSDELTAYFHSNRGGSYEIYTATRSARTLPFEPPMTTGIAGFYPTVTGDGLTMLYRNGGDIETTTRASTAVGFAAGTPLAMTMTGMAEDHPLLDSTGTRLYFTRDAGAAKDMYSINYPLGGTTDEVTDLATGDHEYSPTISSSGLTMYFARSTTAAPNDIWVGHRSATNQPFAMPELVTSANTTQLDGPTWLSPDNCRLYLESRSGSVDFRLYVAERLP